MWPLRRCSTGPSPRWSARVQPARHPAASPFMVETRRKNLRLAYTLATLETTLVI